jgi:hypothetical protein
VLYRQLQERENQVTKNALRLERLAPGIVKKTRNQAGEISRYADMLGALAAEPRLRILRLLLSAHPQGLARYPVHGMSRDRSGRMAGGSAYDDGRPASAPFSGTVRIADEA